MAWNLKMQLHRVLIALSRDQVINQFGLQDGIAGRDQATDQTFYVLDSDECMLSDVGYSTAICL
jgi:hypothetical protein